MKVFDETQLHKKFEVLTELLYNLQFILITLEGQMSLLFLEIFLRFPGCVPITFFFLRIYYVVQPATSID